MRRHVVWWMNRNDYRQGQEEKHEIGMTYAERVMAQPDTARLHSIIVSTHVGAVLPRPVHRIQFHALPCLTYSNSTTRVYTRVATV